MRPAPADHWDDTLPPEDRERYRVAWEAYRCCRDCSHWMADDDDGTGCCDTAKFAAFLTPEDYTCDNFEPKR
jgi:hypothetical protein